jgi:hypothetical protein
VEDDRRVVQIAKDFDTERVDHAMGEEERGINANCFAGGWGVGRFDSCKSRDESSTPKGDSGGNSKLMLCLENA